MSGCFCMQGFVAPAAGEGEGTVCVLGEWDPFSPYCPPWMDWMEIAACSSEPVNDCWSASPFASLFFFFF